MTQTQCTAGPAGSGPPAEPPPDVPRRPALSPSRANDFKQCPLLYRFRAIDRLPEVPSPAQARGTLVHAVLERLFLLPAEQRTPQAARALLAPDLGAVVRRRPPAPRRAVRRRRPRYRRERAQRQHGPADDDRRPRTASPQVAGWLASAEPLLDAYFALEDPRLLEPEARELLVEVELESGLLLRGYVDRVDRTGTGRRHDPGGRLQDRQRAPRRSPRHGRCSR